MLRKMLTPDFHDLWHETTFGYEFTWVPKKSPYKVVSRYDEYDGYRRPFLLRMSHEDQDQIHAAINDIRNKFGERRALPDVVKTKAEYDALKGAQQVVHFDIDCLEVSTPACTDWQWHIEYYRECDAIARKHGLIPYRMRGVEQTQDMHVNVGIPNISYQENHRVHVRLNLFYMMHPVLSWIFAAAYNNDTARIPLGAHEYAILRPKCEFGGSRYIEFRAPCMPKTLLEIRAIGEFHRKLCALAGSIREDAFADFADNFRYRQHQARMAIITFEECMQDFAFWCNLLDVDIRIFNRMAHHNLWRRLKYYPECRI